MSTNDLPAAADSLDSLDALAIDTEATAIVLLDHPKTGAPLLDEEGVQASITIVGTDSTAYRTAERKARNRRLEKSSKGNRKVTAEELDAEGVEVLVAITRGWHLASLAGRRLHVACTPANARKLYADPRFKWAREQVESALGDRASFGASSPTS